MEIAILDQTSPFPGTNDAATAPVQGPKMSPDKLRGIHSNQNSQKKRSRDADLLILLWDLIRTRENEIDHLLDLALCMLLAAPHFPEKTELDRTLQKARSLLRNVG